MDKFKQLQKTLKELEIGFKVREAKDPQVEDHLIELTDGHNFQIHPKGSYIVLNGPNGLLIGGDHHDPFKAVNHLIKRQTEAKTQTQL